jgi:hypothetical protein
LFFVLCSRSAPSRLQILGLIGIGLGTVLAALAGVPAQASTLPSLVVAPWLLHFGHPRPWRWTAVASLLAFSSLWSSLLREETPWPPGAALALAAGLLLLAVPPARQLAREPGSPAASLTLEPLLAVAVVAIVWAIPLAMEPRRPWLFAALMIPSLGWIGWRLNSRWIVLPILGAVLATLMLLAKGLP